MANKKDLMIAISSTCLLVATLFMVIPTNSSLPYDPWADLNADGKVDMKDISYSARLFGTYGDPTKMVIIEGYNCSATSYSLSIPAKQAADLNIDTAGYKQITLGFSSSEHAKFATGFQIGEKYAYVDRFNIHGFTPHLADAIWIEPSHIDLSTDAHGIGYRFNATVWLNLTSNPTGGCQAWEFRMLYEKAYLKFIRANYTASSSGPYGKSAFFKDYFTIPLPPINGSYNSTHNYVYHAEGVSWTDPKPVPSFGSLTWVEFEVIDMPPEYTSQHSVIGFLPNDPNTWYADAGEDPSFYNFSTHGDCIVSMNWDFPNLPEYDIVRTYAITGRILTIRCCNPNDYDITDLTIDAYLTS